MTDPEATLVPSHYRLYNMVIVLEKLYLFVYGTLRYREPFHYLLENAQLIGKTQTKPKFTLLNLGEYPAITYGGTTAIVGEIYEICPSVLAKLDQYEDYPELYDRQSIELQNGNHAITYILKVPKNNSYPVIESGDWSKRNKRYS